MAFRPTELEKIRLKTLEYIIRQDLAQPGCHRFVYYGPPLQENLHGTYCVEGDEYAVLLTGSGRDQRAVAWLWQGILGPVMIQRRLKDGSRQLRWPIMTWLNLTNQQRGGSPNR